MPPGRTSKLPSSMAFRVETFSLVFLEISSSEIPFVCRTDATVQPSKGKVAMRYSLQESYRPKKTLTIDQFPIFRPIFFEFLGFFPGTGSPAGRVFGLDRRGRQCS